MENDGNEDDDDDDDGNNGDDDASVGVILVRFTSYPRNLARRRTKGQARMPT